MLAISIYPPNRSSNINRNMSYGGYNQYGGNPYGQEEAGYGQSGAQGGYGSSNPYGHDGAGQGYGSSNPYGGTTVSVAMILGR